MLEVIYEYILMEDKVNCYVIDVVNENDDFKFVIVLLNSFLVSGMVNLVIMSK